ncbi:hypothetical protein DRO56_00065 [Candidatus Bathyarchaeota archaeon]|nr:MAG: NADH-quinone oxidoreductase subunit M [Candidatus Bathyarchaeota archaeon]RLI34083.1 MAG: hypothetical protein DRO56_00065 [Candidatus Bathyarchaeota archaeon]
MVLSEFLPYPLISLLAGAMVVLFAGVLEERLGQGRTKEALSVIFIALALIGCLILYKDVTSQPLGVMVLSIGAEPPLGACFEIDLLSVFMTFSVVFLGLFAVVYSFRYMEHDTRLAEYYSLLLLMMAGMVGVALAGDFFTFFIFWELMCISSYVLVAFRRELWGPIEAGFKYLTMSALGGVLIFLGMSLLYGMAGNVNFAYMSVGIDWGTAGVWAYLAFILLFLGFGIKAAIVPMHTWLPDAHPEAPSPISAMLSGIVIETGLYGLVRILFVVFLPNAVLLPRGPETFKYVVAVFSVLTMTIGNIMALLQKDIKRLLAYSSIAQVGYMLVGVASGTTYGLLGCFLHVFNHSLMKGLAFLASGAMVYRIGTRNLDEMKGLGHYMPVTTMALAISLLGLGGVPSTNGFVSKFILFGSALAPGVNMWWLTLIGVLNSAFSMAYYLPIIIRLITKPAEKSSELKEAPILMLIPMCIMAILIIVFGIYPRPVLQLADSASKALIEGLQGYISKVIP